MNHHMVRLADFIQYRRIELGLTLRMLAEKSGVSTETLVNFGRADAHAPRELTLARIETALGWMQGSARDVLNGGRPSASRVAALPETVIPAGIAGVIDSYITDGGVINPGASIDQLITLTALAAGMAADLRRSS